MANRCSGDSEEDLIPESILSVSKDARYIQQCHDLFQQSLAILFERNEALAASAPCGQEQKRQLERVRKQITWMISCILYVLISSTTGRTLGMEALGLEFTTDNTVSSRTKINEMTRTRPRRSAIVCILLFLIRATGLLSEYFFTDNPAESLKRDFPDEGEFNDQQQYQERSRGRERRMIHERLRRQMLGRAANSAGMYTTPTPSVNTSNQQAQQEIQLGRDDATISRRPTSPSPLERALLIFRQSSKFIFKVYSNIDGPHTIVRPISNDTESNDDYSRNTSRSIALWLVRLHLSYFLLTGKYPTLVHRFLELETRREKIIYGTSGNANPRPTMTVLDRPNTNRVIAVLILLQASTSLIQNASNWLAKKVATYLETRTSKETGKSKDQRVGLQNNKAQFTNAQLREKLDKFFGNNSREALEMHNLAKGTADLSIGTRSKMIDKTTTLCTICRLERKHPAISSSCGHVFCWNCLIQWVSTVRPECPICRAPCSTKDVLPLHDYEPVL